MKIQSFGGPRFSSRFKMLTRTPPRYPYFLSTTDKDGSFQHHERDPKSSPTHFYLLHKLKRTYEAKFQLLQRFGIHATARGRPEGNLLCWRNWTMDTILRKYTRVNGKNVFEHMQKVFQWWGAVFNSRRTCRACAKTLFPY